MILSLDFWVRCGKVESWTTREIITNWQTIGWFRSYSVFRLRASSHWQTVIYSGVRTFWLSYFASNDYKPLSMEVDSRNFIYTIDSIYIYIYTIVTKKLTSGFYPLITERDSERLWIYFSIKRGCGPRICSCYELTCITSTVRHRLDFISPPELGTLTCFAYKNLVVTLRVMSALPSRQFMIYSPEFRGIIRHNMLMIWCYKRIMPVSAHLFHYKVTKYFRFQAYKIHGKA